MTIRTTFLALAAAAPIALLAAPASAAGDSAGVKYSDLDLTTEHGQTVLARRIDATARKLCGMDDIRTGTILRSRESNDCYERAKASATKLVAERVAREKSRG